MKDAIEYKLDPALYMHPSDRAMLTKLENMKIIANLLGGITDFFCRQTEIQIMGSGIHVTQDSLPEVYETYMEVCEFFGIKNPPMLYLDGSQVVNAYAMGADRAFIVVNEAMLFRLNKQEQKYLFGHELAHVMAGHVKYKTLIYQILSLGGAGFAHQGAHQGATQLAKPVAGAVPFGGVFRGLADITVMPLLMLWSRRSEYTCDRAGMLVAEDPEVAYSFFMKLSGLPITHYKKVDPKVIMDQAEEFQQLMSNSMMDTFWAATNQIYSTHPRPIERAAEVKEWIDEGWYDEIVNGTDDTRKKMGNILRDDPANAEMRMLIIRTVISWAMNEFNLSRPEAAAPIRKALHYNESLRNTPVERILRIEMSISLLKGDKIEHRLSILYNDNGTAKQVTMKLPLPESMDFTSNELREKFIRNGNKPVIVLLYSVENTI